MTIPDKIFKSYDIRGIYPTEINEENIVPITQAIYKLFQQKLDTTRALKISIGRDMRLSSPGLYEKAVGALLSEGATVVDIGLAPTTSFYFSIFHYGYDGGMQISASHNPKEYNGIKIALNSPGGIIKIGKNTGMDEIKKMSQELSSADNGTNKNGEKLENLNVLADEAKNAIKIVGGISDIKPFKIAVDAANAMGSLYINELFKNIPGSLVPMNFELDGTFPVHQPDPLQKENLVDLQKKVLEVGADLGLAPDGDGDRLFFVDEKGQIVPPSIITALISRELLKKDPGKTILFDVRYILTPAKIVTENGGKYELTKVGHAFITEKMHQTKAIFAGESSAHYFFGATGNAESQLPVILFVLKVLSNENKKLSELVEELRRSYESGEINFGVENAQEVLDAIKEKYKEGDSTDLDGVSIQYPDFRLSLRSSNTEPLIRLNIESTDNQRLESIKKEVIDLINSVARFRSSSEGH